MDLAKDVSGKPDINKDISSSLVALYASCSCLVGFEDWFFCSTPSISPIRPEEGPELLLIT